MQPGYAQSCDLSPIATDSLDASVLIDKKDRTVSVRRLKQYVPAEDNQGNATVRIVWRVLVTFYDLPDIYREFVKLRYHPEDRCDVLKTGNYSLGISKDGFAVGQFRAMYENNICFSLRFYEPQPGVRKEPFSRKLSGGTMTVFTAFQPGLQDGIFYTRMAASYEGGNGDKLEKLAHAPLLGFLEAEGLVALIQDAVVSLAPPKTSPDTVRFVQDDSGLVHLDIVFETSVSPPEACSDRQNTMASELWESL